MIASPAQGPTGIYAHRAGDSMNGPLIRSVPLGHTRFCAREVRCGLEYTLSKGEVPYALNSPGHF